MDRLHDVGDDDGVFELPDGVFDSNLREPEMVETYNDHICLTGSAVYWTGLERFGSWPIESTSVDWDTVILGKS
jgi:hypothetical protein